MMADIFSANNAQLLSSNASNSNKAITKKGPKTVKNKGKNTLGMM